MAAIIFDVSKGGFGEKVRNAVTLTWMVVKTAEADATLKTRTTVTDILAHNTEANFTNYARTAASGVTRTVTGADKVDVTASAVTWNSAGGGTNNTTAKIILFHNLGADGSNIPVFADDFVLTTDGSSALQYTPANPFMEAS